MTTEVCRVHILWIFQITKITRAKSPIQNCLRGGFRERVGMITKNIKAPEKSVFIELFGDSFLFRGTVMRLKNKII